MHRFFQLKYEQSCFKWVNAPHSAFCITQMYLFTSQSKKKKKINKNKLSVPICILCHSTDRCFRSVSDQILDYGDRPVMCSFLVDFISQQSTGAKKKKKKISCAVRKRADGTQNTKSYKKKPSCQTIAKMFSLLFKNYKQSPSKVSQPRTDC